MAAILRQLLTMSNIKLIALDLDGTLLNSDKKLTRRTYNVLAKAAACGIQIVPTTGRVYSALPENIQQLPFVQYIITVNGAQVNDLIGRTVLYRAEMPWQRCVELMRELDTLPVIYDCFMDNAAWMTEALKAQIDAFAPDEHYRKMLHEVRQPVPELKAFLAQRKQDVQKVQFFIKDMEMRQVLLCDLPQRYPDLLVTTSVVNNVEFNAPDANKGKAMLALAAALGISREETMSFGDGLNDLSMIKEAGMGVAMANACGEVLCDADYVTLDCDSEGVADAIERFCLGG